MQQPFNLVKNHSGEEGFEHWTKRTDNGVVVESPPEGIEKLPKDSKDYLYFENCKETAFATSHFVSPIQQKIHLWDTGITSSMMRTILPLEFAFSVIIGSRTDCGGRYKIHIALELSKGVLWKEEVLEGIHEAGNHWKKIECKITIGENESEKLEALRQIVITAQGRDLKSWGGPYGIKFSRFCVLLQKSNEN